MPTAEPDVVLNTTVTGSQSAPAVLALADGTFLAVWQDDSSGTPSLRGRILDPATPGGGGDFLITTGVAPELPELALAADGSVVMAWRDDVGGGAPGLFAATLDLSLPAAPVLGAPVLVSAPGSIVSGWHDITALADGRLVHTWSASIPGGPDYGAYSRIVAPGTGVLGDVLTIQTTTDGPITQASAAGLPDGRIFHVWAATTEGMNNGVPSSETNIRGRLYDPENPGASSDFLINTTLSGAQSQPQVEVLPDGRVIVIWQSSDGGDGDGSCIRARLFDPTTPGATQDFIVNATPDNTQAMPNVLVRDDGLIVFVWSSAHNAPDRALMARVMEPQTGLLSQELEVLASIDPGTISLACAPDGRILLAFQNQNDGDLTSVSGVMLTPSGWNVAGAVSDTRAIDGGLVVGTTANGTLAVFGGEVFAIVGPVGGYAGEAQLVVGQSAGSTGALASLSGVGTLVTVSGHGDAGLGARVIIGRGADASLSISSGARLQIEDQSGLTDSAVESLIVGDGDGLSQASGTLTVAGGRLEISGTGTAMDIGRNGANGSATFVDSAVSMISDVEGMASVLTIGRQANPAFMANVGALTLSGTTQFTMAGGGVAGQGASVVVGRDDAEGHLTIGIGAALDVSAYNVLLESTGGEAIFRLGQDGAYGAATIRGVAGFHGGTDGVAVDVGFGDALGTSGVLDIAGGTLVADSTGTARLRVGVGEWAAGALALSTGRLSLLGAEGVLMGLGLADVGGSGGYAQLSLTNASSLEIENSGGAGTSLELVAGQSGGWSELVAIGASTLDFTSSTTINAIFGYDPLAADVPGSGGTIDWFFSGGTVLQWMAASDGRLSAGGASASQVSITAEGAAHLDFSASETGGIDFILGDNVGSGGYAQLNVVGVGSLIEGIGYLSIGQQANVSGSVVGNGELRLADGGTLVVSGNAFVGNGGRIRGEGGTLEAGLVTFSAGSRLGDSVGQRGTLDLVGDLTFSGGLVEQDITATSADLLSVTGNIRFDRVAFAFRADNGEGGSIPIAAGTSRTVMTVADGAITFAASAPVSLSFAGQHAEFGYVLGQIGAVDAIGFRALNSGASGGTATLDFGAAATRGATLAYTYAALDSATMNSGSATGGDFAGRVFLKNIDSVLGTSVADVLRAYGAGKSITLDGRGGADTLTGGAGTDRLVGGTGDDTFYADALDTLVELGNGGTDTVRIGAHYTLRTHFENLILSGIGNLNGTGNSAANRIIGTTGANVLDGKGGIDRLEGLTGDDTYYVDHAGDLIIEATGRGTDTVYASASYTLGSTASIETLRANGAGAIAMTGNGFAQSIIGGSGANTLDGKLGADILTGGAGADRFTFTTALSATNIDRITDFASRTDKIVLENLVMTKLGAAGAFASANFVTGTKALDAADRLVYDKAAGKLYYDADGSGAGQKVQILQLNANAALLATDILVI